MRRNSVDPRSDMSIQVERSEFDPSVGFQYYVYFKPHMEEEGGHVHSRMPIETAVSVSESGDLADFTFEVPKPCRSDHALSFIRKHKGVNYVAPRLFIDFPGLNGDAVVRASAHLDLDLAGRIVGMEILWSPPERSN
ncbi:MAG TPA: hypothetical protein VK473_13110 [Terriglobales bacterium]|nr:hypothetical protein [Terriglobales bacterium]